MNPIRAPGSYFITIYFNIILSSELQSQKWSRFLRFTDKTAVCVSLLPHKRGTVTDPLSFLIWLRTFCVQSKLRGLCLLLVPSASCYFLQPPVTYFSLLLLSSAFCLFFQPSATSFSPLLLSSASCFSSFLSLLLLHPAPWYFFQPLATFSSFTSSSLLLLPSAPWYFFQPLATFSSFTSSSLLLLPPAPWYFLQHPDTFSSFTSSSILLILPASWYFLQLLATSSFSYTNVALSTLFSNILNLGHALNVTKSHAITKHKCRYAYLNYCVFRLKLTRYCEGEQSSPKSTTLLICECISFKSSVVLSYAVAMWRDADVSKEHIPIWILLR
jgi:hypothetical protein